MKELRHKINQSPMRGFDHKRNWLLIFMVLPRRSKKLFCRANQILFFQSQDELEENSTLGNFPIVQKEGGREVKRTKKFYSLEAIIAVGNRVNSDRGREFRVWATEILKSYIHKGFALDSDRMKYGSRFSVRYFDELYEEIRDIRTSEGRSKMSLVDSSNAKGTSLG